MNTVYKKRVRKWKQKARRGLLRAISYSQNLNTKFNSKIRTIVELLIKRSMIVADNYISKNNKHYKRRTVHIFPFVAKLKYFFLGIIFSSLFIFLPFFLYISASSLPNLYTLSINSIPKTTKILDRNGILLYEIYANQNRTVVRLQDVPKTLQDATIAIEDKAFYTHPGFDVKGMMRAMWNNMQRRELQGGSTLTQQLIKSAYLTSEPSISRKVKEILLAFLTERLYSKDAILELYFNYVPYGGTAWGVEAASEIYFGKKVTDLNLSESAFLAGIPRAPSLYSPYTNSDHLWKKRQKEVLDAMVVQKYITHDQAREAYNVNLVFKDPHVPIRAPHFVMYVKDLLVVRYGLSEVERGGLRVTTTLDTSIEDLAENIVKDEVANDGYLNIKNGAALITNPANGDLLAMVGNHNYFDRDHAGNVNITTSLRQPGSTIKMVTYSLALSKGFTEATLLEDEPLTIKQMDGTNYTPVNYDGKFHGRVPIRLAFANSYNIPAVRVAQKLGVSAIVDFGKQMGISSWGNPNNYGPSITLGGADVTMVDLATVYGTVANSGNKVNVDPILEIEDSQGKIIYKKTISGAEVLDKNIAFVISDILADNKARSNAFGPNSSLQISRHRVSVKTGTTDQKRDNWTIGYTGDYVVVAWVGNFDNSPMNPQLTSGITGAAPMWNKIMSNLLKDKPDVQLATPDGLIKKSCFGYDAYFIKGTENSVSCNYPTPHPSPVVNDNSPAIGGSQPPVALAAPTTEPTITQAPNTERRRPGNRRKRNFSL